MKGKVGAVVAGVVIIGGVVGAFACAERIPTGYDGVVSILVRCVRNNRN